MNNIRANDLCFIKSLSKETMNFYRDHKVKNSFLICPCKISRTQTLVVDQLLTPRVAMLHYMDKPTKVTVLYIKDLVKVRKDD